LKNVGHVSNVPVFPANRTFETCATEYFNRLLAEEGADFLQKSRVGRVLGQLLHQRLFSVNCGRVNDVAPHRDKDANRHGALPESDRKDDM